MSDQSLIPQNGDLYCQNCNSGLEEDFEFCPSCGQKTNDKLTISVLFYNTISNYFSFDARFLKSFIPLMIRPGYLAEKFLQGKRLLYLHPAQMYLFISVIFFFIISYSTRELVQEANKINEEVTKSKFIDIGEDVLKQELDSIAIDSNLKPINDNEQIVMLKESDLKLKDSSFTKEGKASENIFTELNFDKKKIDSLVDAGSSEDLIYREMGMSENPGFLERRFFKRVLSLVEGGGAGSMVQAFFDSIPISMFFLLPLFALILKIFYYNKGPYVYHLVFSFYFFSFLFMVFSILFATNRFIYDIPDWIDWCLVLSTYIYFLIALIRFYKQHWFLSWVKSSLISFVFFSFVIPTALTFLVFYSFLMT